MDNEPNYTDQEVRDWFAGQALMGWAAGRNISWNRIEGSSEPSFVAEGCYRYADAMMAERKRRQPDSWFEHRIEEIMKERSQAVVTTDVEGRVTEINRTFTEMCGYTLRELRGKKPGDILQGPQTEQAVVRGFHKAVTGRKPFECTLTNYHKNGSTYRVHIKMMPIKNKQTGSVSGFRAVERKLS